jgi:hypothetical protein
MFRSPVGATFAVVLALPLLSACGGYSPVIYQPVTVPDLLTKVTANRNFKTVDSKSFADAVLQYPTRTGSSYHTIPVGDYLLSRVVLALPEDSEISNIQLKSYESRCASKGMLGPHLLCVTRIRLTVTARGKDYALELSDEADVGPVFIPGDIAPPFTMGDYLEGPIHEQARRTVDHVAVKLRPAFEEAAKR